MTESVWGKVFGSILGFALGGPFGAIFGFIVGHVHDSRRHSIVQETLASMNLAGNVQEASFTMGVIVLGAKMAKADGRVTREEIEAFRRVFNVAPEQEAVVGHLFNRARRSSDGFEPYANYLANIFRANPIVLEEILGGLFVIAAADSVGLSPMEIKFLQKVSSIFGFGVEQFYRIAARAGVQLPNHHLHTEGSDESYAILGIGPNTSNDDIKSAYRALIREHHPDKLLAQGMPPQFIATATEKMKRINVAYDTICKIKGIH